MDLSAVEANECKVIEFGMDAVAAPREEIESCILDEQGTFEPAPMLFWKVMRVKLEVRGALELTGVAQQIEDTQIVGAIAHGVSQ